MTSALSRKPYPVGATDSRRNFNGFARWPPDVVRKAGRGRRRSPAPSGCGAAQRDSEPPRGFKTGSRPRSVPPPSKGKSASTPIPGACERATARSTDAGAIRGHARDIRLDYQFSTGCAVGQYNEIDLDDPIASSGDAASCGCKSTMFAPAAGCETITEQARASIQDWLANLDAWNGHYVFPNRFRPALYPRGRVASGHSLCAGA